MRGRPIKRTLRAASLFYVVSGLVVRPLPNRMIAMRLPQIVGIEHWEETGTAPARVGIASARGVQ